MFWQEGEIGGIKVAKVLGLGNCGVGRQKAEEERRLS